MHCCAGSPAGCRTSRASCAPTRGQDLTWSHLTTVTHQPDKVPREGRVPQWAHSAPHPSFCLQISHRIAPAKDCMGIDFPPPDTGFCCYCCHGRFFFFFLTSLWKQFKLCCFVSETCRASQSSDFSDSNLTYCECFLQRCFKARNQCVVTVYHENEHFSLLH